MTEPAAADWLRLAELVWDCCDFPLGKVDASTFEATERLIIQNVTTHDHHPAVPPAHMSPFELLPQTMAASS
ncbi:MAG TPA: hypothetical protein VFS38_03250 [Actinomycetota bacterium]|nr:hypothetical protein [Actinomycetota bacterium]